MNWHLFLTNVVPPIPEMLRPPSRCNSVSAATGRIPLARADPVPLPRFAVSAFDTDRVTRSGSDNVVPPAPDREIPTYSLNDAGVRGPPDPDTGEHTTRMETPTRSCRNLRIGLLRLLECVNPVCRSRVRCPEWAGDLC